MEIDRKQCPDFFLDYILYITVTKSLSSRTVQEYYLVSEVSSHDA